VAIASARAASGAIGIGVAVLAIAVAALAPLPSVAVTPESVVVTPVSTPQQLVCPGALLRLGNDAGEDATTASSLGNPTVASGSTVGTATVTALDGTGAPAVVAGSIDDPDQTALVSASQTQSPVTGEFSGLATATCSTVSTDAWLVGGSTTVGRTTLVSLANPSEVEATVSLTIYSENGEVSAPGATGIVVPPNGQKVVSLAGFAPDTVSPVVHVSSTGGLIVATMQQSITHGLFAAGVDIVASSSNPATSLVIPGVVITTPDDIESLISQQDSSTDLKTVVRLAAPAADEGSVTINVIPESAKDEGASIPVELLGQTTMDVPLEGLAKGNYTVSITSDVPLVAAVRITNASAPDDGAGATDFAWIAAPTLLSTPASFTVSDGPAASVHLGNPSDAAIDVTLTAPDTSTSVVSVPAKESVSVAVVAGSYQLQAPAAIVANVSYASSNQAASFPVEPRLADADPITIYP
jgi:hypothetical protein